MVLFADYYYRRDFRSGQGLLPGILPLDLFPLSVTVAADRPDTFQYRG